MRILFMGTPDFALFSLKALCENGKRPVGVITQPDKPKGRGYVLTPPPVKVYAESEGIPVYQPKTLKDDGFAKLLSEIDPDIITVVAYGKILPENVLDYPKYGCINVHGSLLPEYRGAAPMQRAIIDGKHTTGVTTMYMAQGLDTGDMLLSDSITINENDNFENIHDRLGECGAKLLIKTVDALITGKAERIPQNDALSSYAEKITKAECLLDFSESAEKIHNRIRGLSPVPLSFTHTPDGKILKIVSSVIADRETPHKDFGRILALDGGKITVACGKGAVDLLRVLPEGKGQMDCADFIRGRKISQGDILS